MKSPHCYDRGYAWRSTIMRFIAFAIVPNGGSEMKLSSRPRYNAFRDLEYSLLKMGTLLLIVGQVEGMIIALVFVLPNDLVV